MAPHSRRADGSRLVLLIGLFALAATAALAFGRVFQGTAPTGKLVAAATLAVAIAAVLERRPVLVSTAAAAAGLALALGVLVFPETTRWLLPTRETVEALREALALVGRTARLQAAPALPLAPLVLAAVIAAWSSAFSAHALAVRARSPFLALLPPASLLAFANLVMEDGARPGHTLPFLGASLAVLFADGVRRAGLWGPLSSWRGRSGRGARRLGPTTTSRGARRIGAASLAVAALGAGLLPGFGSPGVLRLDEAGGTHTVSINPIVDIKPALLQNSPVELFTVRTTRAAYWRFLSLDTFDGRMWKASDPDASEGHLVSSGTLRTRNEVGSEAGGAGVLLRQRFEFTRLSQPWIPAAFDPVAIDARTALRYDPASGHLVSTTGTYPDFSYEVVSSAIVPTPEQLDRVGSAGVRPGGAEGDPSTALPRDLPPEILDIARRLTAGQPNTYRKVLAVQEHLRSFRYDLDVEAKQDANHLVEFLTRSRAGYCVQFAGSMAVLLRAVGIPARVAVGFTPGRYSSRIDAWVVTGQNAHAWVEVLFPGYGWLAFEPTPTRSNPIAGRYLTPGRLPVGAAYQCPLADPRLCLTQRGGAPAPDAEDQPRRSQLERLDDPIVEGLPTAGTGTGAAPDLPEPSSASRFRLALLALLALMALAALAIPAWKVVRRRRSLALARTPAARVLAEFDVLAERASDIGLGRRPHETLLEYRERLRASVVTLDGDLDRLTALAARAAYGRDGMTRDEAREAVLRARRVRAEILHAVPRARRAAGWFRPPHQPAPR